MKLIKAVENLRKTKIRREVKSRLREFKALNKKSSKEWFCEMCFCILTANSKAKTALAIQQELSAPGFCTMCHKDVRGAIKKHKHRFHNNKARYIVEARKYLNIKDIIKRKVKESGQRGAREWLVKNVKGIGYKEASHFLRNVGYFDLAILDRHIINLMLENRLIKQKPKTLSKNKYLKIEETFRELAGELGMSTAELDLYMWYLKTGKVMK